MLTRTLATEFRPSSNLKGQAEGANWSLLLPSIELGRVLVLGAPDAGDLPTLARLADRLVCICSSDPERRRLADELLTERSSVEIHVCRELPNSLERGSFDLIAVLEPKWRRRIRGDSSTASAIRSLLSDSGSIYVEQRGKFGADKLLRQLSVPKPHSRIWLSPMTEGVHAAMNVGDEGPTQFFLHRRLAVAGLCDVMYRVIKRRSPGTSIYENVGKAETVPAPKEKKEASRTRRMQQLFRQSFDRLYGWAVSLENLLYRRGLTRALAGRMGILCGTAAEVANSPPRYLTDIAAGFGIDLTGYRWGLASGGRYRTRKTLFYLFRANESVPHYIVKLSRAASDAHRLEQEFRGLQALEKIGFGGDGAVARPAFFGIHAGCAVLGQSIVEGASFDHHSTFQPDCPWANDAVTRLTDLAVRTHEFASADATTIAVGMEQLLGKFVEAYRPPASSVLFLQQQIRTLAASSPLPLVYQHGDPGRWNMLARPDGKVAILDWESFESDGMPLWDLMYFLRSFCVGAAQRQKIRDSHTGIRAFLLEDTPHRQFFADALGVCARAIDLDSRAIRPLIYLCWMHRAIKESTRLIPGRMHSGSYYRLLEMFIAEAEHPLLKSMLTLQGQQESPAYVDLVDESRHNETAAAPAT